MILHLLLSTALFSSFTPDILLNKHARNFRLQSLTGKTFTLSELRGKVVYLNFWATWTKVSKEELPHLAALQKKYGQYGFTVLAVSVDNHKTKILKFLKKHNIELITLWDRKKRVARRFLVETMPSSYLIDRNGRVRYIQKGYDADRMKAIQSKIEFLLSEPTTRKPAPPAISYKPVMAHQETDHSAHRQVE
ncbi:MAG: TlpA disulfide reductase family protein [candidate division KSB1 bacterium]|nr:TlpA disulfide reductase family protein [candidate division KSB1 bacterium]